MVDLAEFDIDIPEMYDNIDDNDNPLSFRFRKEDEYIVPISNPSGVKLRGLGLDSNLSDLGTAMSTVDTMFFPYLKVKDDSINFIKPQSFNQIGSRIDFSINNSKFDLGKTFGPGNLFSQEIATSSSIDTRSTVSLSLLIVPNHLDTIRVYHQNGSTISHDDQYGRYDDIIFINDTYPDSPMSNRVFPNGEAYSINYPTINKVFFDTEDPNLGTPVFTPNTPKIIGSQYVAYSTGTDWIWNGSTYIPGVNGSRIYVNLNNTTILAANIIEIVKNLKHSYLTGKSFKNTAFIQVAIPGNTYGQLAIRAIGATSTRVQINGFETTNAVYADGGFKSTDQAIIPIGNINRLMPVIDRLVVKTEKDWSVIMRVYNSVVSIDEFVELTEDSVSRYFSNATLLLKHNEPISVDYGKIEIREIVKPKLGVLSIFEIKDIDFYTYLTKYAKIPEIDLYQYYYIPKDTPILDFTKYVYEMVGSGEIKVNGTIFSTTDSSNIIWQNITGLHEYTVLNGDVILVQTNKAISNVAINRYDIPILDQDKNLKNFTGFFAFGADHSVPDKTALTYEYREKYKNNNLLSEYHVYLENFSKEFATDGRVIPYISKWGIIDSTDARGNQYRLNSDILFGKDNFGPSHRETAPTAEKLTHEWFYIESDFNYSQYSELIKLNNYYFNEPLSVQSLISEPSYFETYFTYIPKINGLELDRPQFRYSKLNRDQFSNQYSTVFNGAKFIFSELDIDGTILSTTDRFKDYNFSILLKPVKEDLQNPQVPIKYRVIENIDAKSVLLLIELAISGIDEVSQAILIDNYKFPDNRIDQLSLFLDGNIISELIPSAFPIKYIYTTENSTAGDAVFNSILSSSYPSFSSSGFLAGTTIEPALPDEPLYMYIPKPGDTLLIKKGSDTVNISQYVVTFEETNMFKMISSGKLQVGSINVMNELSQYLNISLQKIGYLGTGSSKFRIISDAGSVTTAIRLSQSNELIISRSVPGFLSIFGDYRLSFNDAGVSNLSYNFLYSVKDKKYNSTKGAYSTVKLAIGVDLSTNSNTLSAKELAGVQTTEFKLENFINTISGSHDTLLNNPIPLVTVTPPLPAFAPLMFINTNGEVSILLNTEADFNLSRVPLEFELSDPTKTNHAIIKVNGDQLTLEYLNLPKQTVILKANLAATNTGAVFNISKQNFPTGSTANWLIANQQFQLFGGKDYFANLFENLSFAAFAALLEKESSLISWESYQNGSLLSGKKIKIQIEDADLINKNTIVSAIPEIVNTSSKTEVGGFTHIENQSTAYDLYRYSGEYDVIYQPISGFNQNTMINDFILSGANVFLNPGITNFFIIPEFSFVKYSDFNILDFENSQKFEPLYPMIYESPLDYDKYNVLSSSWDFNYHYEYSSKKDRLLIPGSRRLTEDYSFISKLLNVPMKFTAESFNSIELTNREFEISDDEFLRLIANAALIDLAYSVYPEEVRFKMNFSQIVAKALSETVNGEYRLRVEFEKFFKDANSNPIIKDRIVLGDLSFDQYLYQYCTTNLLKLYMLDTIDFYERADHSIKGNSISIAEVPYSQLDEAGYVTVKTVKINNTNAGVMSGSILIKSSSGISLVPKLKIKYI